MSDDRNKAADDWLKQWRLQQRQWWKALSEAEKELFLDYGKEQKWSANFTKSKKTWLFEAMSEKGLTVEQWINRDRENRRREREEKRARSERYWAEKEAKRAEEEKRLAAALEALAKGEPVPAKYRPPGGICICCRTMLRDPVSVKWGIGPDCMSHQPDSLADVKARYNKERAEYRKQLANYRDSQKPA